MSVLSDVASIATALAVPVAGGSVYAAFQVYKLQRRDQGLNQVRATIFSSQLHVQQLYRLLDFGLPNQLSREVIYSPDVDADLARFYASAWEGDGDLPATLEVPTAEDQTHSRVVGVLTMPILNPVAVRMETIITAMRDGATPIQTEHPALYRVITAAAQYYYNMLRNLSNSARNEQMFDLVVDSVLEEAQKKETNPTFAEFRADLFKFHTQLVLLFSRYGMEQEENFQSIFRLVTECYAAKSDDDLMRIARHGRRLNLAAVSATKTITEDLLEARRGLEDVLSAEQLSRYTELTENVEQFYSAPASMQQWMATVLGGGAGGTDPASPEG